MKKILVLLAAGILLAGCGSKAAAPPPKKYQDKRYGFTFKYPASWTVGAGKNGSTEGTPAYVVNITIPSNSSGMEITVDHNLAEYSTIPEGKIATDPNGGPDTFHYHHLHVSGWPAIQVERFSGTDVDEIDTIVNVGNNSYDARMITGTPPFKSAALSGYHQLVRTFHVKF